MVLLKGSTDESIVVDLDDGSEVEITLIEIEGKKSKVVRDNHEAVSVLREHLCTRSETKH